MSEKPRKDDLNIFEEASETSKDFFSYCKQECKKVKINNTVFFIVENCLLYTAKDLRIYANRWQKITDTENINNSRILNAYNIGNTLDLPPIETALIGGGSNSARIKWKDGTILSYHIDKSTFSEEHYNIVREIMPQAANEWENTCGVKFQYRADSDNIKTDNRPNDIVFSVLFKNISDSNTFALTSCHPRSSKKKSYMVITPLFFTALYNKQGMIRHELGHVLGFYHEHIDRRAPPECPDEPSFGISPIGDYDKASVMHYLCQGVSGFGTLELNISDQDRILSQKVYGPPLA
jgi:hypothetical protein